MSKNAKAVNKPNSVSVQPMKPARKKVGWLAPESLFVFITVALAVFGGYAYRAFKDRNSEPIVDNISPGISSQPEELFNADGSVAIPKGANAEGKPREATKDCLDRHEQCVDFAKNGECLKTPGWMIINCPRSCDAITNACALRDPKLRCDRKSLNMTTEPVYKPGDMSRMFNSLVDRFGSKYNVEILSRDPWVAHFDNFISDDEGKALISTIPKFERSTDSGIMNEFGEVGRVLSTGRTSSNGWCGADCANVRTYLLCRCLITYLICLNISSLYSIQK
jgi:hypothetical protein